MAGNARNLKFKIINDAQWISNNNIFNLGIYETDSLILVQQSASVFPSAIE